MKQRKVSRWRQLLGKMLLGFGSVVGRFNGSANGPQIIDIPDRGQPVSKRRNKRRRRR
jgi:hypothetical protein